MSERNLSVQDCTVEIRLIAGHELVSRDSNGKSDPYVKFKQDGRDLAKSRIVQKNLNPVWNEQFVVKVKKGKECPIQVKVLDYDFGLQDDFMGSGEIDTSKIEQEPSILKLFLNDPSGRSKESYMGYLELECRTLSAAASHESLQANDNSDRLSISSTLSRCSLMSPAKTARNGSGSSTPTLLKRTGTQRGRHSEWSAVVSVVLIEADNISGKDPNALPDSFCKIKLGTEKYKSKVFPKSKNPRWLEQFCLYMYDSQSHSLEIAVLTQQFTRRTLLGHVEIDLSNLERDRTHPYDLALQDGSGRIKLRVTVNNVRNGQAISDGPVVLNRLEGRSTEEDSGIHADIVSLRCSHLVQRSVSMDSDSYVGVHEAPLSDDSRNALVAGNTSSGSPACVGCAQQVGPPSDRRRALIDRYSLQQTFADLNDIGVLTVRVWRAEGLLSADMNGFSDPFCVLELENDRVQTHTAYKTLDPVWNRAFTFLLRDLHSVLDITVFDEDSDRKHEFLGKLSIPILEVTNNCKTWFALKDRSLAKLSQGGILLEFELIFNHVRAAIRTVKPKEVLYRKEAPKLKIAVLRRNIERLTSIVAKVIAAAEFMDSCIKWESPIRTICAFIVFELVVYNFELYLLPLGIAALMIWGVLCRNVLRRDGRDESSSSAGNDSAVDEDDEKPEDKKSLRERLQTLQDTCLKVQVTIGGIASFLERASNVFGCRVPWLSYFGIFLLTVATLLLYFVPLRRILLLYGVYKFSKKKLRPNAEENNELADFISRSPDNVELEKWKLLQYKPSESKRK